MPSREERKAALKKRIYEAAIDLFCEQGYQATSLINIAEEAEVSTRTLYKYYPSKEDILRQFTGENIMATLKFSRDLPTSMPLKDKFVAVMVYDYEQMFCLFDVALVLVADERKPGSDGGRPFELDNFFVTESIYYDLMADEQRRAGRVAGRGARLAASILMGVFRHCCDLYRFSHRGRVKEGEFKGMVSLRLDAIWPSIERLLATSDEAFEAGFDDLVEDLPVDAVTLETYRKGLSDPEDAPLSSTTGAE